MVDFFNFANCLWLTAQPTCNPNQTQKPKSNLLHSLLEDDEYRGSRHYLLLKKKQSHKKRLKFHFNGQQKR
jgi:hypothetical protein